MQSNKLEMREFPSSKQETSGKLLLGQVQNFSLLARPRMADIHALKEFFYSLIGKTDADYRRQISILLSQNAYTPRQIAIFLALDPIAVATPILLYSPILGEKDFLNILERTGDDHAFVIAQRRSLPKRVLAVLQTKINARSTPLSGQANRPQKQTVIAASKELNAEQTGSSATTARLTPRRDASSELLALAGKGGKLGTSKPRRNVSENPVNLRMLTNSLLTAARTQQFWQFSNAIERTCKLNAGHVRKLIEDKNAGNLATLFCALSLPEAVAGRLLLLLCPMVGRNHKIFQKIMHEYKKLDQKSAIAFFKRMDPNFGTLESRHHVVTPLPDFSLLLRNRRSDIQPIHSPATEERERLARA